MIKALISTGETQGDQPGDYTWVPEGELVARYGMVCDSEQPDGTGCGCGRGFAGFDTHRATTTAKVVEVDMTEIEWRASLFATLVDTGWADAMEPDDVAGLLDEIVELDVHGIAELPVGAIVGRLAYNGHDGATVDSLLLRSIST